MSHATKFLLLAASIIITCVLVWYGFRMLNIGSEISKNAMYQMQKLNSDIKDSGIMRFNDNDSVTGSDIVNFMKEYLGDYEAKETGPIYITVIEGEADYTYKNGFYIQDIKNFTSERYIPPTAVFSGEVIKNENDIIVGVKFIKL